MNRDIKKEGNNEFCRELYMKGNAKKQERKYSPPTVQRDQKLFGVMKLGIKKF